MDAAWPRSARYVMLSSANWLMFLAAVGFLTWQDRVPQPVVGTIVAAVAATVALQFFAAYRLVAAQDEFVRGITVKRTIAAAGITITVAVLWGLGVQFLGWRDVPMWVIYPFFWGAFGMVTPFIHDSHA